MAGNVIRIATAPVSPATGETPNPLGIHLPSLPPLSLYVHIPWCVKKCPYCDFNSHEFRNGAGATDVPEDAYVAALIADLEQVLPLVWGRRVHSVFFGGGTPSLFSARALDDLLTAIRARLPLEADAEITLEANPGTFEAEKFRDYRVLGINRLSIGIQSFNATHLKALGRIHDDNEAHRAIAIAQKHFENFNLDLMYALPNQTLTEAEADIAAAIAAGAPHVSAYHLTLEPNTLFYRYPPSLPDDDASATMQEHIEGLLALAGYQHYETSAFSKPGRQAKHNVNYWEFGDYIGIGAGAHSKLSFSDRIVRQAREKHPREYMQCVPGGTHIIEERKLTREELPFEYMMNALRLTGGFPVARFTERTGLQITAAQKALEEAEQRGFLTRDFNTVKPTLRGQRFLNDLLQLFL